MSQFTSLRQKLTYRSTWCLKPKSKKILQKLSKLQNESSVHFVLGEVTVHPTNHRSTHPTFSPRTHALVHLVIVVEDSIATVAICLTTSSAIVLRKHRKTTRLVISTEVKKCVAYGTTTSSRHAPFRTSPADMIANTSATLSLQLVNAYSFHLTLAVVTLCNLEQAQYIHSSRPELNYKKLDKHIPVQKANTSTSLKAVAVQEVPIMWLPDKETVHVALVVPNMSWPLLFGENHLAATQALSDHSNKTVTFRHPAMNFTISCDNEPASNNPQAAVTCLLTGEPNATAEHSSTTSQSDTSFTHLGSNKQDFINLQDPTLKVIHKYLSVGSNKPALCDLSSRSQNATYMYHALASDFYWRGMGKAAKRWLARRLEACKHLKMHGLAAHCLYLSLEGDPSGGAYNLVLDKDTYERFNSEQGILIGR
ncbi:hypothetical protein OS493_018496 [Desmophyllum pertusum]|uniref:Uncharacterized protein n=1 Tax=Desmophyllum pertusum TaxID=174260 RepID=A0A9X0A4H6_9CNID|nr:hypothetical protein OS493_018496 [Desmophyllum pertusum]